MIDQEKLTEQTNADRIRGMTIEELADKIFHLSMLILEGDDFIKLFCDGKANCIDTEGNISCGEDRMKGCIIRWLRRPAEE